MNFRILLLILLFAIPASAAGIIQSTAECDLWSRVLAGKLLAACGDNTVMIQTFTSSNSADVDLDSGPYSANLRAEGNIRKYKTMTGFAWRREGNQETEGTGLTQGYMGENVTGGLALAGVGDTRLDVNDGASDLPFSLVIGYLYLNDVDTTNNGAPMIKHELTSPENHGWQFPVQHSSSNVTRCVVKGSNEVLLTQSCVLIGDWGEAVTNGWGATKLNVMSTAVVQIGVYNGANAWTLYHNGDRVTALTNAITPNVNFIGSVCPARFILNCNDKTSDATIRTKWYFAAIVKRAMTAKECKEVYLNMRGFYAL